MPDEIIGPEFPSNSKRSRKVVEPATEPIEPVVEPKQVTKVVTSLVQKKKKNLIDRFSETFFGDDAKSVGSYVFWDVLIPSAKDIVSDVVTKGIDRLLFGEDGKSTYASHTRRERGRSIFDYNSISGGRSRGRAERAPRSRSLYAFEDIIIAERGEAEEVLDSLIELIETYDVATVGDFYDLVGVTSDFTDNKYGWSNLSTASVSRVRDGYILNLPRPAVLN
jgi:hypothetical protein